MKCKSLTLALITVISFTYSYTTLASGGGGVGVGPKALQQTTNLGSLSGDGNYDQVDIAKAHGTGGVVFPTDGSISVNIDAMKPVGYGTFHSDFDAVIRQGGAGESSIPFTLDLSDQIILSADVANLKTKGFTKIKIGAEVELDKSFKVISKENMLNTLYDMKMDTPEVKVKNIIQTYENKVGKGLIDLVFVTDDEDQVILMDSKKIK